MPSKELTALLFELERSPSPLDRLQVVARAWRSVRALDRRERQELARRIGFDGAEEVLERLAARGGLAPATLLEVVRRARSSDPEALDSLVAGLSTPGGRESAVLEGLRLAEELLEAGPEGGPGDAGPDQGESDAAEARPPAPTRTATPAEGDEGGEASPAPAPRPTPPVASPARVRARSQTARPTAAGAPPARPRPRPAWGVPAPGPPPTEQPPALPEPEAGPPTGNRRLALRALERRLGHAVEPGELEAAVLGIPDGWARRRAVLAAIRHGQPPALALRLVAALGQEHDRRWCLAALLAEQTLAPDLLVSALGLVSSEPARRRLARLAARGGC